MNLLPSDDEVVTRIAKVVRGGVIVYPTDTLYRAGCDTDSLALGKVRRLKGREEETLLVLVSSMEAAKVLGGSEGGHAEGPLGRGLGIDAIMRKGREWEREGIKVAIV